MQSHRKELGDRVRRRRRCRPHCLLNSMLRLSYDICVLIVWPCGRLAVVWYLEALTSERKLV